jgi:cytochrome P450
MAARTFPFERRPPHEPPEEFAWLRGHAPVCQVRAFDGSMVWLLTGYEEVRAALADPRLSRRELRELACRAVGDGSFDFGVSVADPPGHSAWRRVVSKAFGPRQAEAMRESVRSIVAVLLDELAAAGPAVDLMAGFAFRLPIAVLCELLDVPPQERERFVEWADAIRNVNGSLDNVGAAMRSLGEYVAELVDRGHGTLLRTLVDGGLTGEELVRTLLLVVLGGYETTGVQLGNGLFALLRHPEQLAELEREPELLPGAVEEVLRYAQASTGLAAALRAVADVQLGGVTIPAGSTVFVSPDSANRDATLFDDPDRLDVRRAGAARHLTFGAGPHYCLGAQLARVQLQEALGGLLRRFPRLRLAAEPDKIELTSNLFSHYPRTLPVTLGP